MMRKLGSTLRQKSGFWIEAQMRRKSVGSSVRGIRHLEVAVRLIHELFIVLLTTSVLLLLLETIWAESVSTYLNLNCFFIAAIFSGVIVILSWPRGREEVERRLLDSRSITILCLAGLAVSIIVFFKVREIGSLSYIISLMSGGLTMLMLLIVWREDDEREDS